MRIWTGFGVEDLDSLVLAHPGYRQLLRAVLSEEDTRDGAARVTKDQRDAFRKPTDEWDYLALVQSGCLWAWMSSTASAW